MKLMGQLSQFEYNTLSLDVGLPHKMMPESTNWQSHFLDISAQQQSPVRLCA